MLKRESNIELLRIVSILLVISLHLCKGENGFLSYTNRTDAFGMFILNAIYCLSLCAVDVFLIISGYFSVYNKKRILGKPIELICICIFFKLSYYLFFALLYGGFVWNDFFKTLIPDNYFINIFCVCYALSPFFNVIFLSESKKNLTLFMILLFSFFSIWPTIANVFLKNIISSDIKGVFPVGLSGTDQGFTLVNFMFCYSIGAYTRVTHLSFWKKQRNGMLLLAFLISVFTILVIKFPCLRSASSGLDGYDSVFTILIGWVLFLLFKDLSIPYISFVNFMAKSTFGVYIIHTSILWMFRKYLSFLAVDNTFDVLLKYIVELILTYTVCIILYKILGYIFSPVRIAWRDSFIYKSKLYFS